MHRAIRAVPMLALIASGTTTSAEHRAVALRYEVRLDEAAPLTAEVRLTDPPSQMIVARGGGGAAITELACAGRPLAIAAGQLVVPRGCPVLTWWIALADGAGGVDASLPPSAWMPDDRFWFLAERHGFLRPPGIVAATVRIVARRRDGRRASTTLRLPGPDEPPFYAVIGARPTTIYRAPGFAVPVWGNIPDIPDIAGLGDLHSHVVAALARLRRDVVPRGNAAPRRLDLAWLPRSPGMAPGYAASAGANAIGAQVMLRAGDPDAAAKGRAVIASSAVHEGFHAIIGPTARGWPAWMNESLASHFALESARRFLPPIERTMLDAIFGDDGMTTSLLAAQRDHARDPDAASELFYRRGAHFWREIEAVLSNRANRSGRLAALLQASHGFRGVDTGQANALAAYLDRHSAGRAGPIVHCYLEGRCPIAR